jgi:hypothetical protein
MLGMRVIDPGHVYGLSQLDGLGEEVLTFVKREGGVTAVSVECLWQGTKVFSTEPDPATLAGAWRRGKAKRPKGAYAGLGEPLLTSPGVARRAIYIPTFKRLVEHWLQDTEVQAWIEKARQHTGPVYLRDFDTGRGLDRNGPMSHAWVLAVWLNTGSFPS